MNLINANEYFDGNITKFYLIYNKKDKEIKEIVFINLSKEFKEEKFELFKKYPINLISKYIYKEDFLREIEFLKTNINQEFFQTFHCFIINENNS